MPTRRTCCASRPGILLTNEGGEGHAEQVYMRGFDAREGQDVEFTVGGVPINESGNLHGNGYADTHFIIPELIESLRVVEGPFDPRQGNYAVAGSADYELGLEQRGLSASATAGSWGTRRVLGLFGPPGESTHTFGGAEIYTDRRLRPEPRRAARLGDGAVRRALRRDRLVAPHRAGLRVALPLGGRHPRGRLPVRPDRLLRQLRPDVVRAPGGPPGRATPRATRSPPTSRRTRATRC